LFLRKATTLFELFFGTTAAISVPVGNEGFCNFSVALEFSHLKIRAIFTFDFGAFVPIQAKPPEAFQNGFHGFWCGAALVRVFDSEDKFALQISCVKPVEECGPRTADMKVACG
jgi:hypothetical protein